MDDQNRTDEQLRADLTHLRRRVAELEALENERRRVEDALRQSHDQLQAICDQMGDGLVIVDLQTRRVAATNRAIQTMLGYSEEELLSLTLADFHRPEDLPQVLENIDQTVRESHRVAENIVVLRKDGGVLYADISATTTVYNGRAALLGLFRDITEQKKTEKALRKEQKTLRRLLEASDRELKLISYEIHDGIAQPLAAAEMQCQVCAEWKNGDPQEASKAQATCRQLLSQCIAEARRLIGRVRLPLLDELGVVAAVRNLVTEKDSAAARVEFDCRVKFERLEPILENTIYRIVQEGIANAQTHSRGDRVVVGLVQDGDLLRVEIQDWGIGFDAGSVRGKAYGLNGIRERARLLGGRAVVESAPDQGTRVVVELPLVVAEAVENDSG